MYMMYAFLLRVFHFLKSWGHNEKKNGVKFSKIGVNDNSDKIV